MLRAFLFLCAFWTRKVHISGAMRSIQIAPAETNRTEFGPTLTYLRFVAVITVIRDWSVLISADWGPYRDHAPEVFMPNLIVPTAHAHMAVRLTLESFDSADECSFQHWIEVCKLVDDGDVVAEIEEVQVEMNDTQVLPEMEPAAWN